MRKNDDLPADTAGGSGRDLGNDCTDHSGSSSQPQLCWNFWLPKLKRTYCQAWQVPAGWIAGSMLQNGGNFVNDNREPQGGSGNLYWQQLSAAQ